MNYHISEKSDDKYSINHNPARIRIDSFNSLPTEKIIDSSYVIILIKFVFKRDKSDYYYNIFLEKGLYKKSNAQYF